MSSMSVRRNNENAVGSRRALGSSHGPTKILASKPLASKENQRTVLGKTVNASTKPSASSDKPDKSTSKPGTAPRRALSSLTNGTPQARQPLSSKPSKQAQTSKTKTPLANRTLSTKTPQVNRTSALSKTPANARSVKKTLSVYTPAQDRYQDDVEYMPPALAERSYAPHSAFGASGADEDIFASDMTAGPKLTFEAAEQDVPLSLIDSPGGLDDFRFDP